MPLYVLALLVVVGIGSIAVLLHASGRSRQLVLTDDVARDEWLANYPDDIVVSVRTATNGASALVQTGAGPGLIWAFGSDTAARHLKGCEIRETADGLRVDFHDFAAPPARFTLTPEERALWRSEMEAT